MAGIEGTLVAEGQHIVAKIELSRIAKSYGKTKVLNEVSLSVADGEFVSLVGPSGCGKSTLLRILAGLESLDGGDVVIDGRNVNDFAASKRDLAMVFQSYALYPHLTVKENLTVPLKLRDMTIWQRLALVGRFMPGARGKIEVNRKAVEDVAEMLKITELLDRKPGQLSGGQRQRVAVGRAIVRNPVAFLMDEPLSNLDAALRVHMRAEIADLHRQLKATFIYVTHDQAEALTMSDRVAVMMGGDILQFDTPAHVYSNPADKRVAEFIGSPKMNMLPATVDGNGKVSVNGLGVVPVVAKDGKGTAAIGIRPEHVSLGKHKGKAATIRHLENLGSELYAHCQMEDIGEIVVVRADMDRLEMLEPGSRINLSMDFSKAFLFGADERRIAVKGKA